MTGRESPFPSDPDRHEIWTMLVERDIAGYVAGDWSLVEDDFVDAAEFVAVDARNRANPDSWRLGRTLDGYRDNWLAGSVRLRAQTDPDELEAALHDLTTLRDIEIRGDDAIAHKKFDGTVPRRDGSAARLDWQTLYLCRRVGGRWRIRGFVGYLPSGQAQSQALPGKQVPPAARQHATAGPYSPVLTVGADRLVVLSGQAAIAPDGSVVGSDIEEQTRLTLENCRRQLATAGCDLTDVVKVNVYLSDMALWERFNTVYREVLPEPRPVRTAVGAALLDGLLVEVEMWAARS
ncbi:MAG TPA: RidA family protein [Pseudonocardia sp.]|nr:RidA family protein [Pseudonocardia sp.]